MNFQLVPMDRGHLSQVAALERSCFPDPWSEQTLEHALYHDLSSLIVAEGEDGAVLGYGVHQAVLDCFLRFGREHLAFLTLEVRAGNRPAIQFYLKNGFEQVGRRPNYYRDPQEDAIIMTLEVEA